MHPVLRHGHGDRPEGGQRPGGGIPWPPRHAAQGYEATRIACADEDVEHPWAIAAGPADSGLEIEVANEA